MKILVIDVAAEYAGALTILEEVIKDSVVHKNHQFDFYVSQPKLKSFEDGNIKIHVLSWVKKSWLHRLYFELVQLPKIVKKNNYDVVLSLQNVLFQHFNNVTNVLFVHQSLQYLDKIPRLFSIEGAKIFIRKFVLGPVIHYSVKKADTVLVQTNWIKKELLQRSLSKSNKIIVVNHSYVQLSKLVEPPKNAKFDEFIYPSAAGALKNHIQILNAMVHLNKRSIHPKVYFTISPDENATAKYLYDTVQKNNLNVEFTGRLDREVLLSFMKDKTVIFPSLIETFGLPLYEAMNLRIPVIALNRAYSKEALSAYSDAYYFNGSEELSTIMLSIINKSLSYQGGTNIIDSNKTSRSIIETILSTGDQS